MRVAIASAENDLEGNVADIFGRCAYFLIVDTEKGEISEVLENVSSNQMGGAGVSAAQAVAEKKVDAVISGNLGPRALDIFRQFGIAAYKGEGKIKDVLKKLQSGELQKVA